MSVVAPSRERGCPKDWRTHSTCVQVKEERGRLHCYRVRGCSQARIVTDDACSASKEGSAGIWAPLLPIGGGFVWYLDKVEPLRWKQKAINQFSNKRESTQWPRFFFLWQPAGTPDGLPEQMVQAAGGARASPRAPGGKRRGDRSRDPVLGAPPEGAASPRGRWASVGALLQEGRGEWPSHGGTLFMSPWGFSELLIAWMVMRFKKAGHILPLAEGDTRRHNLPVGRHQCSWRAAGPQGCGPKRPGEGRGPGWHGSPALTLCFSEGSLWGWTRVRRQKRRQPFPWESVGALGTGLPEQTSPRPF